MIPFEAAAGCGSSTAASQYSSYRSAPTGITNTSMKTTIAELLTPAALRWLRQAGRHVRFPGGFPCAGNHPRDRRDRIVEPPLHHGAVGGKEGLVVRLVIDIAIADGVTIRLEQVGHELRVQEQRVEQKRAGILDRRDGLRRDREAIAVALERGRLPARVQTPLLRELAVV